MSNTILRRILNSNSNCITKLFELKNVQKQERKNKTKENKKTKNKNKLKQMYIKHSKKKKNESTKQTC